MLDSLLGLLSNAGYIIQVIFAFGLLVVAHEFGHFIVAKWTGCRVDEFAVGFGPAIWQHKPKNSETLYAWRWIPLGGYNRIWGYEDIGSDDYFKDISPEEQKRAFVNRPIWARALVLVAGSTFNFLLAILLVALWGMTVGFPYTEIGEVMPGSPAEAAGIKPGDGVRNFAFNSGSDAVSYTIQQQLYPDMTLEEIFAQQELDNERMAAQIPTGESQPVMEEARISDWASATSAAGLNYRPVSLQIVDRESQKARPVTMTPIFNAREEKPMIGIVMREAAGTRIAVVREGSVYEAAGLKKGDEITAINGKPVLTGFQVSKALDQSTSETATVTVMRGGESHELSLNHYRLWNVGFIRYPDQAATTNLLQILAVIPGSAADIAGLEDGDIVTNINGRAITRGSVDWDEVARVAELPPLEMQVVRTVETVDKAGNPETRVQHLNLLITPDMVERVVDMGSMQLNQLYVRVNPIMAFGEGIQQTGLLTAQIWSAITSLFSGQQGVNELAGPIGIFHTSFIVAKSGLSDLLMLMLLLTVNLGIFNLLPFPALDGGRLIFLGLEALFRRPVVNIRIENLIHVGGFLLLIGFVFYISYFDISRLVWSR